MLRLETKQAFPINSEAQIYKTVHTNSPLNKLTNYHPHHPFIIIRSVIFVKNGIHPRWHLHNSQASHLHKPLQKSIEHILLQTCNLLINETSTLADIYRKFLFSIQWRTAPQHRKSIFTVGANYPSTQPLIINNDKSKLLKHQTVLNRKLNMSKTGRKHTIWDLPSALMLLKSGFYYKV